MTVAIQCGRRRCGTRHRTYRAVARCRWPRAEWVHGEGRYAVVAYCRVVTVTLHPTPAAAARAKHLIDASACGGRCHRDHELVDLHHEHEIHDTEKRTP